MPDTPMATATMADLAHCVTVLDAFRDEWPPELYDYWHAEIRRRAWWLLSSSAA